MFINCHVQVVRLLIHFVLRKWVANVHADFLELLVSEFGQVQVQMVFNGTVFALVLAAVDQHDGVFLAFEQTLDVLEEFECEGVNVAQFVLGDLVGLLLPVHALNHLSQTFVLHCQVALCDADGHHQHLVLRNHVRHELLQLHVLDTAVGIVVVQDGCIGLLGVFLVHDLAQQFYCPDGLDERLRMFALL